MPHVGAYASLLIGLNFVSGYNFTYNRYEDWAYIDIALAKVETPYKFDRKIAPECTWIPNSIDLSYDYRHVQPGSDAMVLGWGSAGHWRSVRFEFKLYYMTTRSTQWTYNVTRTQDGHSTRPS